MRRWQKQSGFTMIELLLAMAIFSMALVIVSAGFINIVRLYQSGLASRSTQQNARLLLEEVSRTVRDSGSATPVVVTTGVGGVTVVSRVCLQNGSRIVVYAVDGAGNLRQGTTTVPTCPAPAFDSSWKTVNDSTVRVTQFAIDSTGKVGPAGGTVMMTITVASKNNLDNLDDTTNKTTCRPGAGSQFCAVTTLSSTATLRGGFEL